MTAKILRFPRPDPRLVASLTEARDELQRISESLHLLSIRVATDGVWREWSDSVPDGTVCSFDPAELQECGDPSVRELTLIEAAVDCLIEEIEVRLEGRGSGCGG